MPNITSIQSTKQPQYMGQSMLNEFRQVLTNMRNEHTGQLKKLLSVEIDNPRMPDENDVASMREAAALEMSHLERNAILANQIDKSLTKIDSGEYGYCDECGDEIGEKRLRVQPIADLCISCKETAEKAEHRYSARRAA